VYDVNLMTVPGVYNSWKSPGIYLMLLENFIISKVHIEVNRITIISGVIISILCGLPRKNLMEFEKDILDIFGNWLRCICRHPAVECIVTFRRLVYLSLHSLLTRK